MAGTTTNYNIPYPENTDPVDVAGDIQAIATNLDTLLNTELNNIVKTDESSAIVVNSSSDALRITQTGTGNAFLVEDSANPDATPFVISSAGLIGIGTQFPTAKFQVVDTGWSHMVITQYSTNSSGGSFVFQKHRGTESAPTIVANGDTLGDLIFNGNDGSGNRGVARIIVKVDGSTGSNDIPTQIGFFTSAAGSGSMTERLTIRNDGKIGIGTPYPSSTLDVAGDMVVRGSLNSPYEPVTTDESISAGVLEHSIYKGNVVTISSPSANFTLNITGLSTTDNQATTVSIIVTQGATGYIPSALQIGGSAQTIKWQGGSAPTPTSSSGKIDIFSFTITRLSSTWTVYGSMVGNF